MITINALPNELLGEILGHAMHIPDELFTSNAARSPFGTYAHPHAARRYLLVNKRWRDAGLRPLYHDIVLRSRAQATALASTLRQDLNLALMVHKLRVEGGFGVSMAVIMAACTNITDLCLLVNIDSHDSSSGICLGLRYLSPTRLVLLDMQVSRPLSENGAGLLVALQRALPQWGDLTTVMCAVPYGMDGRMLAHLLQHAPNLRTVILTRGWRKGFMKPICELSTVHEVVFRSIVPCKPHWLDAEKAECTQSVRDKHRMDPPVNRPPSAHAIVNASTPEQDFKYLDRAPPGVTVQEFRRVVGYHWRTGDQLVAELRSDPRVVDYVQEIVLHPLWNWGGTQVHDLRPLLEVVHNLKSIRRGSRVQSPAYVPWDAYELLIEQNGCTLETLEGICLESAPSDHLVPIPSLWDLSCLRHLSWDCTTVFNDLQQLPEDALAMLESITIAACHPTFARILSKTCLSSLKKIYLHAPAPGNRHICYESHGILLHSHGWKLDEVELDGFFDLNILRASPNVQCLTLHGEELILRGEPKAHGTLAKIFLPDMDCSQCIEFIPRLHLDSYPALREIHWRGDWPWTEHAIASNGLIPVVDHILSPRGVKFYDKEGVAWVPRLRVDDA
ncbi:uncharacterized protein SCHCODRAFT_02564690 [Schizophyllum commune H4-8]|nr:uncharacterized protein SCHCODRAFT_02564690 [Schizophyllum commune H4-8]KAI5897659.1 hypothetical protein SCHCODRAFT_02564690 [Schizophyllum commune H4-8]